MSTDKSTVMLLSGGIDSAVGLRHLQQEGYRVTAVTMTFSARDSVAVNRAGLFTSGIHGVPHSFLDLSQPPMVLPSDFKSADGVGMTTAIAHEQETPFALELMIWHAFALAVRRGIRHVALGVHEDDFVWDGNFNSQRSRLFRDMMRRMQTLASVRAGAECSVLTPFLHLRKQDVIAKAPKLGVVVEDMLSCTSGERRACGQCRQCRLRESAIDAVAQRQAEVAA